MSHDCKARINELLMPHNTQLADVFALDNQGRELFVVLTERYNPKVKAGPIRMFASHCPFCGVKL